MMLKRPLLALGLAGLLSGCSNGPLEPSQPPVPGGNPGSGGTAVLAGAGDIAVCGVDGANATARLLDRIAGGIFTTGDNAYPSGTDRDFAQCYDPTWGRHRERTR